jgi:hypothetical protein
MVSRVQNIRSTNKNTRPPVSTRQPGEFFVNFADKQFGVIDPAQTPQDLIAIRFHSAQTDYAVGDHVIYQGRAYRAKQVVPASTFNPTYWETAGMADAPADGKFYGRANNAWDLADIVDIVGLQTALDLKAPLASPALSGVPTAPTAAPATANAQIATTSFVKAQNYATIGGVELTSKVSKTGDAMSGPLTLYADPTVPLHAATKGYVDNKPSGASTIDIPPAAAVNGQLWWETDTGGLFVRYDDGSSQQWVQLNGEMGNAVQKTGDTMSGNLKAPGLMATGTIVGFGANMLGFDYFAAGDGGRVMAFGPNPATAATMALWQFSSDATIGFAGLKLDASGTGIFNGNVVAKAGGFTTTGNAIVMAPGTPGAFYFRPNGLASNVNQLTIGQDGTLYAAGHLNAAANVTGLAVTATNGTLITQAPTNGNALVTWADWGGNPKWYGFWDHTNDNLRFNNVGSTGEFQIFFNGRAYSTYGYATKAGTSAAVGGYAFNFQYVGGLTHLWIDATDFGTLTLSSDYRIKKDIEDLPSTWDTVKNLRPISYTQAEFTPPSQREMSKEAQTPFIHADDIERWGFIAHELQEDLLPSAANGDKDAADTIQSINLAPVVAALTKALQEAMTRIEALEGAATAPTVSKKRS